MYQWVLGCSAAMARLAPVAGSGPALCGDVSVCTTTKKVCVPLSGGLCSLTVSCCVLLVVITIPCGVVAVLPLFDSMCGLGTMQCHRAARRPPSVKWVTG